MPESGFGALHVGDRVADGLDFLGIGIRYRDIELFLDSHDELDDVEAVGTEVIDKMGVGRNLVAIGTKLVRHKLRNSIGDVAHPIHLQGGPPFEVGIRVPLLFRRLRVRRWSRNIVFSRGAV